MSRMVIEQDDTCKMVSFGELEIGDIFAFELERLDLYIKIDSHVMVSSDSFQPNAVRLDCGWLTEINKEDKVKVVTACLSYSFAEEK